MKKSLLYFLLVIGLLVIGGVFIFKEYAQGKNNKELRVLAWIGYDEDEIVKPFEQEFGIKVKTETFIGGDKMFAKLTQNPDAYDVVVIDPEYISKLHNAGLLRELNPKDFDFSNYIDPLKNFPLTIIDGKLYAVLVRFGVNAIVYNKEKLTKEEVSSYKVLWSPKVKGHVGIWDWYLPNMGVLSLADSLNKSNPYQLTDQQLQKLNQSMVSLKPQVKAVFGSFSDINAAFTRGDIWIAPGLGEHTASILAEQGNQVDWIVPKEGGIMWIETLGITKNSNNTESAIKYINYMQRPDVQAKLTWRNAYRSNIPSIKGIETLSKEKQDYLKVHNGQEATELVNSVDVRLLPTDNADRSKEKEWQEIWQNFKVQ